MAACVSASTEVVAAAAGVDVDVDQKASETVSDFEKKQSCNNGCSTATCHQSGPGACSGEDVVTLQHEPIDMAMLQCRAVVPEAGAVSIFLGVTRNNFDGRQVVRLEYEAYEPMAKNVMRQILRQARSRWPDICNAVVVHRLGVVPVTEASVCIVVSSPHRRASLESVQYIIDELKALVPIWKKEVYCESGEGSLWKANSEWDRSKAAALAATAGGDGAPDRGVS